MTTLHKEKKMDEVIKVEEEKGEVTLNLKGGGKVKTPAKTINTYYKSGRKDCKIEIQTPIELMGRVEEK